MLRAEDVARYFLANQDTEHGEPISHLKIQKLCYYAQGIALAILEQPLFLRTSSTGNMVPLCRPYIGNIGRTETARFLHRKT